MDEAREVRCRCGKRILTVPLLFARCPYCGRRLFRQCQCGALVERTLFRCPYCGTVSERSSRSSRPPIRLRVILGAGLVGALVFAFIGHWLTKNLAFFFPLPASNDPSPVAATGGTPLLLSLRGVWLLVGDLTRSVTRVLAEQPITLIFGLVGFLVAAGLFARCQQFSWQRLKRHLSRR